MHLVLLRDICACIVCVSDLPLGSVPVLFIISIPCFQYFSNIICPKYNINDHMVKVSHVHDYYLSIHYLPGLQLIQPD